MPQQIHMLLYLGDHKKKHAMQECINIWDILFTSAFWGLFLGREAATLTADFFDSSFE